MEKEKISLFENKLVLKSTVEQDNITEEISKVFDYQFDGEVQEEVQIPVIPSDFNIGLIVGSSGSGKSTILHSLFGNEDVIMWDNTKSIASHFASFEEASDKFGAVGLNSIPTWLKPYNVLSNGEKFRADMARRLQSNAVIDEFTSVVNREVAISCSCSIEKYIRKNDIRNVVFSSCHDDIIPYLQPDWVYNTDTKEFYNGRYLQRPEIQIDVYPCEKSLWYKYKKFHYLSGELNKSAHCYVAVYNGRDVGFIAVLSFPSGGFKHGFREHRLVVNPDYQGMGIGNRLSEAVAQAYIEKGCRYFAKTSNIRVGAHRDRSSLWVPTSKNHKARKDYFDKNGNIRVKASKRMNDEATRYHANRVCFSHEYIGDGTKYEFSFNTEENNQDEINFRKNVLF